MREILLRGKRTDNDEWVDGFYICVADVHYISSGIFDSLINGIINTTGYKVIPETVCQFTGLYDKNGRRVFEGDIVERGGRIWLVEYSNKYGQFMMTTYTEKGISWSRSFDLIPPDWCEVIGNIYDNPELLEV